MTPNALMIYTAPNGQQFLCTIVTGSPHPLFHDMAVRRDDDGRMVWADPAKLTPVQN
jgi:hypothetical protein